MRRCYQRAYLLIVLLSAPYLQASEEALLAVPVPEDATVQNVAIDLVQSGHRLSIANMKTTGSLNTTLEFYRIAWADPLAEDVPGFVENIAGDWSIISRLENGWNQVVQLRDGSEGIEGRISVLELLAVTDTTPAIEMPSNAILVSSTGGQDVGIESMTYVVFSESGVDTVADFYRRHFEGEGWSRVSDRDVQGSQVLLVQREGARAEVVVSHVPNGGTLVVINKVIDNG